MFRKYCHAMSFFDGSKVPLKSISMQNKTNVHWTWNMLSSRHLFSKPNNYLLISSTWIFSLADWKYLILPARKIGIFLYMMKMSIYNSISTRIQKTIIYCDFLQFYTTYSTRLEVQIFATNYWDFYLARILFICRTKIHKSSFLFFHSAG